MGFSSNFFNFVVYSFIYQLTNVINLASFLGYIVGLLNSFYFSDKWVFSKPKDRKLNYALFLFFVIYIIGGFEMIVVINIVNNIFQDYKIAWLCGGFIAAASNYICLKYFLFKD